MQLTAIILILISAVTHAGWNLVSKRNNPTASLFLLANTVGGMILLPLVVYDFAILVRMPVEVWWLLGLTSVFMTLYYSSLAAAYRHGDISLAYPLARSSPIIVVTVVTLFLSQGSSISNQCIVGIVLVVSGCIMLPVKSFGAWRVRDYLKWSCLFALLAAIGTSGYSIIDDRALRMLRQSPELGLGATHAALLYITLEAWGTSIVTLLILLPSRKSRAEIIRSGKQDWFAAMKMGVGIYFTYAIVLVSMGFVRNVSYVVAFRQLSIPIGAMLGVWLLKEPCHKPKVTGIIVLFAGLILVGTG